MNRGWMSMAAVLPLAACSAALNYTDPAGPRYGQARVLAQVPASDTLRVVTFNIAFARRTDLAIELLRENRELAGADLIFLQEMDAPSAALVADSLGLSWVYYPATHHPETHRDFGNAILSRYPILDDTKLPLPHLARGRRTQRAAVAATLLVGSRQVRVYDVHLATMVGNGPNARRDQLRVVLEDADRYTDAIIAGDFNSETVPALALDHGFRWPTRHLQRTSGLWTFDHVLLRGFSMADSTSIGVVADNLGASDHRPVWAVLVRDGTAAAASGAGAR
jgi:endonuclease/exonuclease/phosphatase family metal-dependent hydrolase